MNTSAEAVTGGCRRGRVRYVVAITDDTAYRCHCRMCQPATGGEAVALKQMPRSAVTWTISPPDRYRSLPIAERGFCSACGTSLTYGADDADDLDLTFGSFDAAGRLRPVVQTGIERRHDTWLDTRALPASHTVDNPDTAARWIEACGTIPD